MIKALAYAMLLLLHPFSAFAGQAFDVASVRPSSVNAVGEGSERENIVVSPGSLTMRNVSLRSATRWAYRVRDHQISGPSWLGSAKYDIVAKVAGPAAEEELRLMLQALLADRFKLELHRESKDLTVYAMVVKKNGPKLHKAADDTPGSMRPVGGGLVFSSFSMGELADRLLSRPFTVDRPVIDRTGINGRFDFTLMFADNEDNLKSTLEGMALGKPESVSILAILREQLGLKFEVQKGPVDILVIDHVTRASEN